MRVNAALGVAVLDRGLGCPFATPACSKCYYIKFLRRYPKGMDAYHKRREQAWQAGPEAFLSGLTKYNQRARICKGGESIRELADVDRLYAICNNKPDVLFWVPTRAHLDPDLFRALRPAARPANLRLLASTDFTTTPTHWTRLIKAGWSTMYYHVDNSPPPVEAFKCPKTWEHAIGACSTCEGCFSSSQINVWLKYHT